MIAPEIQVERMPSSSNCGLLRDQDVAKIFPSEDFLRLETLDNSMLLITCFMIVFPIHGILGKREKGMDGIFIISRYDPGI